MNTKLLLTVLFSLFVAQWAWGQIPQTMSYQGILTDAEGNAVNGNRTLTFSFYEQAEGGEPIWQETQEVEVANGLFNVILGSSTPLNLPFDKPYWLGITVEEEAEMAPRIALTSSPYSLNAVSTLVEPEPGQTLSVRNADGEATHVLSVDGDVTHAGTGSFAGGLRVTSPDTAIVIQGSTEGPALFIVSPDTSAETLLTKSGSNAVQPTLVVKELVRVVAGREVAVFGKSDNQQGVVGKSNKSIGVQGESADDVGVLGKSIAGTGVQGQSQFRSGVFGLSTAAQFAGVRGKNDDSIGVVGESQNGKGGVFESEKNIGMLARGPVLAGDFEGKVRISDLPPTDEDKVVIWAGDKILKHRTIEDLVGSSSWSDDVANNQVTTNSAVIVNNALSARSYYLVNSDGDTLTRFNEDGTSEHFGFEEFFKGTKIHDQLTFLSRSVLLFAFLLGGEAGVDALLGGLPEHSSTPLTNSNNFNAQNTIGLGVSYLNPPNSDKIGIQAQIGESSTGSAIIGLKTQGSPQFSSNPSIAANTPTMVKIPEEALSKLVPPTLDGRPVASGSLQEHNPVIQGFTDLDDGASVVGLNVNPNNSDPAVWGSNSGGGAGVLGQVTNQSSNFPAVWAVSNAGGSTVLVDHSGSIGDFATFRNDGANQIRFDLTGKGFFNGGTQTGGADIAEAFEVEDLVASYEPGDVIAISTENDRTVTKSSEPYSPLVIGVYASKPGVLLTERSIDENLADTIPVGVVGVIPTKVSGENGPIRRGDLLVAASTPGHAMKGTERDRMLGATIGKALEEFHGSGTGVIRVLVNVK